jgi:hypothetical protein
VSTNGSVETNLDLLHQAFEPAAPVLTGITAQIDVLTAQKMIVEAEVARLAALCSRARSVPAAVFQLIDRCRYLIRALNVALAQIDQANDGARDLTDRALTGLAPARADLNVTLAQQARGDLYNRLGH